MTDKNTTIKIDIDLEASSSSVDKIGKDIGKGVDSGIQDSLRALREKEKQIISGASSSIYKYGKNHLETRATIGDLSKTRKAINFIEQSEIRKESIRKILETKATSASEGAAAREKRAQEKHDLDIENKKTRNEAGFIKKERLADQQKSSSYFNIPVFSGMLTHLKSVDETGKKSLLSLGNISSILLSAGRSLGPAGLAVGGIAAAVAVALKVVSSASNSIIGYASSAFGTGISSGTFAALETGGVYGSVGSDLADSISANKLFLSPQNRLRQAQLNGIVTQVIQQYGGYKDFNNLRFITGKFSEADVYKTLLGDIGRTKNTTAALAIAQQFGLSDKAVLGVRTIGAENIETRTAQKAAQYKDIDNLTASAFSQSSSISNLISKINLGLAPAVVNLTNKVNAAASAIGGGLVRGGGAYSPITNQLFAPLYSSPAHVPGNTAKGVN